MDWLKAIQIGFYVFSLLRQFIDTGDSSFTFDVSYKGNPCRVTVNIQRLPATAIAARKVF